jgi:glycosyltransferase involved in cell wall biosynthesis
MSDIFILIPSLHPAGPVRGAIALANSLVSHRRVVLVVLKSGPQAHIPIHAKVEVLHLYEVGNWLKRLRFYKKHLRDSGKRKEVVSISSCFSPDVFNFLCRKHAITCSSVRGNLLQNYWFDYGFKGTLLAVSHLFLMRGFNHVVAMTEAMSKQVSRYLGRSPVVIGNFVDEKALEPFRRRHKNTGGYRFVFVGSLTKRKQPLALIEALEILSAQGHEVFTDFIGDGPLRKDMEEELVRRKLTDKITLHGHLKDVHHLASTADAFVLPSSSEGISRACLEALYLGVPCVLRDVDGNGELIQNGATGFLFHDASGLPAAMLSAAKLCRTKATSNSLLPSGFRQDLATKAYLNLVEGV